MPSPEVWGPATWTLFHVLAEKVNENIYPRIAGQLFYIIKRICSALPCPECAQDATQFLAKVQVQDLKTKNDLKNLIYVFHNYVNVKKRKPLFKYVNLEVYKRYNIVSVFNRFISFYHTKGNMQLLAESFQRQLIVRTVREWFSRNFCFFMPSRQQVPNVEEPTPIPSEVLSEVKVDSETPFVAPSDVLSEENVVIEEPVNEVNEEPVNEVIEEPVNEVIEEQVNEVIEEQVNEVIEEPVNEVIPLLNDVKEEPISHVEPISPVEPILSESTESDSTGSDSTGSDSTGNEETVLKEDINEVKETKPKRGRKKKTA